MNIKDNKNSTSADSASSAKIDMAEFSEQQPIKTPKFPLEVLPDEVRDYIVSNAKYNADVVDFSAITYLTMVGAIIGNKFSITSRVGWNTRGTLWVALIGEAGVAKSPSINSIIKPIRELEREKMKMYKTAYADHKKLNDLREKKDREPFNEFLPRFLVDDATIEAIGQLLSQVRQGLFMVHDELNSWFKSMTQYSSNSNSSKWLKFWNNFYTPIDRATKDSIIVDVPSIPVLGGIQPEIMAKQMRDDDMQNSGFIDRILPVFPSTTSGKIPSETTDENLYIKYDRFCSLMYENLHADPEREFVLDSDASKFFLRKVNQLRKMKESADIPIMKRMYDKFSIYLSRLTLIVYVSDNNSSREIDTATVAKAWSLIKYFIGMTKKVYLYNNESANRQSIHNDVKKQYPSKKQARYLALKDIHNWSWKLIAEYEKTSVGSVKVGIHRERKKQ